jgi:DNA-directed RNA polymerase subunit N (RpoN/RPB10)
MESTKDYYYEYPIRCKTCNSEIGSKSIIYNQRLEDGMAKEDIFNMLSLDKWCCRHALMFPTTIWFNIEKREIIEGYKSVDSVTLSDLTYVKNSSLVPSFGKKCGEKDIKKSSIYDDSESDEEPEESINVFANKYPEEDIDVEEEDAEKKSSYYIPYKAGDTVINTDTSVISEQLMDVGIGKKVVVLTGRTFLAR